MRKIEIQKNESGQRLDKFLKKYLSEAGSGFIYKMLRKKNITLNGKKAAGSEQLAVGDCVVFYLSEDTLEKFCGRGKQEYPLTELSILYEDEDFVLINKPAGMLSQRAKKDDTTLVEYFLGYLQHKGDWQPGDAFTPGICNRLDRNTSGAVIAGKSLAGLQTMSYLLKERRIDKYYLTIVEGVITESSRISGYLSKDEKTNKVTLYHENAKERSPIETGYEPLSNNGDYTLLRVKLITGKTHQIRAHLADIGHPLLCDIKYGGRNYPGEKTFFLHAVELVFPDQEDIPSSLRGKHFSAPLPPRFQKIKEKMFGK